MAISSGSGLMSEINVTPLVDVMLVLLIIFIVTAPLMMQAVPVNLPKAAAPALNELHPLELSIDAGGKLYLDGEHVTLDGLETHLKKRAAASPEIRLQVHADTAVAYGRVAEAVSAANTAGISRIALVTTPRH